MHFYISIYTHIYITKDISLSLYMCIYTHACNIAIEDLGQTVHWIRFALGPWWAQVFAFLAKL